MTSSGPLPVSDGDGVGGGRTGQTRRPLVPRTARIPIHATQDIREIDGSTESEDTRLGREGRESKEWQDGRACVADLTGAGMGRKRLSSTSSVIVLLPWGRKKARAQGPDQAVRCMVDQLGAHACQPSSQRSAPSRL
jgi:hypothetical protein